MSDGGMGGPAIASIRTALGIATIIPIILMNLDQLRQTRKVWFSLAGLGLWRAIAIVLSYAHARIRPNPVEDNFEQWVTNRFGRRLYDTFFKTYTEKVWGVPCTEIRAEWAAQRIQGLSLGRAILNATSLQRRSQTIKTLIHTFRYPRLGPGQMWEACRDRIVEAGNEVRLGHRVTGITVRDGAVEFVRATTPDGPVTI